MSKSVVGTKDLSVVERDAHARPATKVATDCTLLSR